MAAKTTRNQRTPQEPQPAYDWRSGRYVVTGADGRQYRGDTAELALDAARRGKGGAVAVGNGTEERR
jgi:hypothetical protein